ncbi:MAG: C4-type zinc ribbon domain-containing protein [Candidatus Nanopelagicales bacterium]
MVIAPAIEEFPLNADPTAQLVLLEVQEHDSHVDQLEHRLRTLPEHSEIERLDAQLAELRDQLVAAETDESDLQRELAKSEADVEQVRLRAARDQQRLNSGGITSAKELESLQHEIGSLARRQGDLEEIELEVMERLEATQSRLQQLRTDHTTAAEAHANAVTRRDQAVVDIDKEIAVAKEQRASIVSDVPADLVTLYEKLRRDLDGVGAAPLRQGRCGGCRLELNNSDIGRIRSAAPEEVLRCEECRRILVRTDESGL